MKFRSTRHFFAVFAATILFLSFSSQHPAGRTGAPGDGLCSDCHGGGGGGFDGDITLSGLPSNANPGQVYNLTVDVDVTAGSPTRAGFQIVALRNTGNSQAGVWSNNSSNSSFRAGGGRTYFGHFPAVTFGGGSNVSWSADWEAPAISDDVTFYMVSILANGSGSGGDKTIVNEITTTIEVTDPIEIDFVNIVSTTCNGADNGSAEASVMGGTSPYMYAWDNGDDTAVAMNLNGGSHSITVTDNDGTQMIAMVTIPEPDAIDIDEVISDISCIGEDDGIVELNPFGGTGSLDCNWGGSIGMGCDQEDLEPGIYFVTVSDENACENIFEIEVEEPNELAVNLSATDVSAAGNDGIVSGRAAGGTGPFQFEWSNGESSTGNTSMITGLTVGTYSVTVTDSNGCIATGSAMVSGIDCNLVITSEVTDVNCFGESSGEILLTATGISSSATFNWSNGATTSSLIGIPAGIYDVTVTENASCMDILTGITVGQPDSLQTAITLLANPACSNAMNGRINLAIAGGTEGYDLLWSNGLTNDTTIVGMDTLINLPDTLAQLAVGTYAYTLTDANGCTLIDSVILNNSDVLPPTILLQEGTVVLDESGFAEEADFSLVDAGTFDNCEIGEIVFNTGIFSCDDIGIQTYEVQVFDTNGNSSMGEASIVVLEMTPPVIDCSASAIVVNTCGAVDYPTPTATDNCDVPTLSLIDGLASGSSFPVGTSTVTYSAVDECGNSSTCSFEVTVNNDLSATFTVVDASCAGGAGSISPNISGGSSPYTVEPSDLSNLDAGTYDVVITDSNGCVFSEPVSVGQINNNLDVLIATTEPVCNGEANGSVTIEVTGGSGNYTIDFESGIDPTALSAGTYEVVVTDDADGCQSVETFVIGEPSRVEIVELTVLRDPCTGNITDLELDVRGGIEPYSIDADTLGNILVVTLSDANGCSTTANVEQMLIDELLTFDSNVITDSDGSDNGAIDITVVGGIPPYAYSWTDSSGNVVSTEQNIAGLSPGDYSLTVTDSNGCTISITLSVDMVSSIVDLDKASAKVKLYPNPSSEWVTLEFLDGIPTELSVIDAQGREVEHLVGMNSKEHLNVSEYLPGIYILRMQYDDFVVVKTFFRM